MSDKLKVKLLKTGVPGLDEILGAGLPELSFNIIGGSPGSGKTTFAQQIMFSLATPTSKALFFTAMGEPPVKMLRYQQQFDFFDFDKVDGSIEFINLAAEVEQGNFDLVLAQILDAVRIHAPAYVFIDSFRSFIQGAKGEHREIQALQSFVQQLVTQMTGWHATTFLVGEYLANEADQNPIFTVADGIIWLNQVVQRNAMVRKVQVIKMRGQRQRPGMHTFRISNVGVEIFPRMIAAQETTGDDAPAAASASRLSMGVPELDGMLGGGLPSGYSMLLVGPSGSGKSTLATEFVAEGVRQDERCVIALFEKSPSQMMNGKLDRLVRSGKVAMLNVRTLDLSVDETLHELVLLIDQTRATRVVLDSLSAFELALAPEFREDFRESLFRMTTVLTEKGVTLLMTAELEDRFTELRFSPNGSAFLVDAIVMLRYIETEAEIRTLISVIKVRGSAHSREFRVFEIGDDTVKIGGRPAPYAGILGGSPDTTTG
ncbi:protein kinase [Massilia eurypsychrophila]|uniref:non-specific serine/threonine protein kinase n=1 Tax=Massilia eurypsychrophila TaxID=1485217 RepID=A0A2G8TLU2_9BURK|nr:ATPase domain-containing protein [Massilia eurypsychrophila]PIL47027.1 protein kinase [Massilia eurypsychrophila]